MIITRGLGIVLGGTGFGGVVKIWTGTAWATGEALHQWDGTEWRLIYAIGL